MDENETRVLGRRLTAMAKCVWVGESDPCALVVPLLKAPSSPAEGGQPGPADELGLNGRPISAGPMGRARKRAAHHPYGRERIQLESSYRDPPGQCKIERGTHQNIAGYKTKTLLQQGWPQTRV